MTKHNLLGVVRNIDISVQLSRKRKYHIPPETAELHISVLNVDFDEIERFRADYDLRGHKIIRNRTTNPNIPELTELQKNWVETAVEYYIENLDQDKSEENLTNIWIFKVFVLSLIITLIYKLNLDKK